MFGYEKFNSNPTNITQPTPTLVQWIFLRTNAFSEGLKMCMGVECYCVSYMGFPRTSLFDKISRRTVMTLKFPHQWPVSRRLSLWGRSTSSSHNTIFQIWGRQVVYEIKSSVLMLIKILDLNFCGQLRQVLPHSTQYHTLFISSLIHFS